MSELCYAMTPPMPYGRTTYTQGNDSVYKDERWRQWWIGRIDSTTKKQEPDFTPTGCKFRIPLAIRTNALYDVLLVPNIGLSVAVGDRFVAGAGWMGTWLNDSKHHYYRIYGGDLDLSWRLGGAAKPSNPFSGHHVGVYASLVYYDIQTGERHRGYLSDKYNYAAGLSYTYSLPVARHFDIAFSIGLGYMWGKFMRHRPIDGHDVWISTHKRSWFGPTRAAVSVVWVFGRAYNSTKGGHAR